VPDDDRKRRRLGDETKGRIADLASGWDTPGEPGAAPAAGQPPGPAANAPRWKKQTTLPPPPPDSAAQRLEDAILDIDLTEDSDSDSDPDGWEIPTTADSGRHAHRPSPKRSGPTETGTVDVSGIIPEKTQPPEPAENRKAFEQARAGFPPELWARLDERLVYAPLARDEVARIAQLLLADSSRRLWDERRIAFRTGPGLVEHLIDKGGYQTALGARPMRQVIQRLVESPLADEILAGRIQSGEKLLACAGAAGVEFRRES